jgi:hypothetical protein
MLVGIQLNVMQNRTVNNKFKQLREIVENSNEFIIAHSGMIAPFKYRFKSRFLPYSRESLLSQAQMKYMPKKKNKNN